MEDTLNPKRNHRNWLIWALLLFPTAACSQSTSNGQTDAGPADAGTCTLASTWTLVDDFQFAGGLSTYCTTITVDPSGTLYIGGSYNDAVNVSRAWSRKSTDGVTWITVDDYVLGAGKNTNFFRLHAPKAGQVFFAGDAIDAQDKHNAVIRKSMDGGATWSSDVYQVAAGYDSYARYVASDSSNNLYMLGGGIDAGGIGHWFIRRSLNSGASYITIDDYPAGFARGLLEESPQKLHAIGHWNSVGLSHWIVRANTGTGGSFQVEDDYQLVSTASATGFRIFQDPKGTMFALGEAQDAAGKRHWIVRRRAAGQSAFTTVDDFQYRSGIDTYLEAGFAVDKAGNIYVGGDGGASEYHWIVRRSTDGGLTFSTFDDYQYVAGKDSGVGNDLLADQAGNIYAAGNGTDSQNRGHSLVRKLSCR